MKLNTEQLNVKAKKGNLNLFINNLDSKLDSFFLSMFKLCRRIGPKQQNKSYFCQVITSTKVNKFFTAHTPMHTLVCTSNSLMQYIRPLVKKKPFEFVIALYITQGDPKVTPYSKIKMVCFWSVISSFIKHEKKVHCMDFHLKFNIFLFVYLNVVEFFKNYYSWQLVC